MPSSSSSASRRIERMSVPAEWRAPLPVGRLLILSPFDANHPRITAEHRNRFAAALAHRIPIPYAAPGSKTEAFVREVEGWGKRMEQVGPEATDRRVSSGR